MLYRSFFQRVLGAAALTVSAAGCVGAKSAPEVAEPSSEFIIVATHVTVFQVSFPGPSGQQLSGVLYRPAYYPAGPPYPAVVMMHGCSGMWSSSIVGAANPDGSPNLQGHIERWGRKLAERGIVALAVDSFTNRAAAEGATEDAFQHQCSGNAYAGSVNPYTTRARDLRHAKNYLVGLGSTDESRVGLLGTSITVVANVDTNADGQKVSFIKVKPHEAKVTASVLNVREKPSISVKIIDTVKKDDIVLVMGRIKIGYHFSKYLA